MAVRQQQRRGTASQWAAADPILSAAEIGFEIDTNKFKIGDGTSRWVNLVYFTADAAGSLQNLIDGAPGVLNTLNELAAAVGDDANFFTTVANNLSAHSTDTTSVHGIADTTVLVTQTQLTNAISGAEVNQAALAGVGIDWNSSTEAFDIDSTVATKTYADSAVSTEATTRATAVTAAIATAASDATTKANAAQAAAASDATTKANAAQAAAATYTDSAVSTEVTNRNNAITTASQTIDAAMATSFALKADLASPALTGTPTASTASLGTNTTQLATTAFVKSAIENISDLNLVLDGGGV